MEDSKDLSENFTDNNNSDDESKNAISADLIRGHINTIILRTLYERDKYGYEIIEEIEKKSHGQYSLKQPTLYSALKRLESQGYINAYWKTDEVSLGGRRKYYTLTDSGREITEKNQAEWEYSRTVIDNLISDRSFDFSQPAPSSVDFKILKKSTSRVPVVKDDDGDEDDEPEEEKSNTGNKTNELPKIEIKPETVSFTEQTVIYEAPPVPVSPSVQKQPSDGTIDTPSAKQEFSEPASATKTEPDKNESAMSEEQRRIVHENYLRLISEPVKEPPKQTEDVVPVAEDIDTDKLIYNNKPETERDYRNLINNLYNRTVNGSTQNLIKQQDFNNQTVKKSEPSFTVKVEDISEKAENDGLKVNLSDYNVSTHKKSYNRGATLLKSSLIVAVVLLLEFTFGILFRNDLGVSLAYPFVIFAIAIAQLLIFGVLYYTDFGKTSRKPTSTLYISASIILTIIFVFIILLVSILLNVNFASVGDIFAKIIIPCFVALNIPLFSLCFYAFSK